EDGGAWREEKTRDGGTGRKETRDGGAGREGASETRSWRPRSDDPAARGNGVAARHILDSVGGLLPFFVSLRRLLTVTCRTQFCGTETVPGQEPFLNRNE
ncbi:unnamed protein product, partial [Urochloa humidicola]